MRFRRFLASCVPLAIVAIPTLSASCTATANIDDVYMSLDGDGARRRTGFFTDSTEIHCIAEGGFGRPDVDVEGRIHQIREFGGGTDPTNFPVDSRYVADIDIHPAVGGQGAPPTKIDIALKKTDKNGQESDSAPYPAGSYICEVLVDGEIAKTAPFNISFPPCPAALIPQGSVCDGFYVEGTQCPQSGALGQPDPSCACTQGAWDCK